MRVVIQTRDISKGGNSNHQKLLNATRTRCQGSLLRNPGATKPPMFVDANMKRNTTPGKVTWEKSSTKEGTGRYSPMML